MPSPHRLPLALFALLALGASLAPVFAASALPLLDEPNHLSAAYIWSGLLEGDPILERYYELSVRPVSYFLHYGMAVAAAPLLGVEGGHKLALAIYVLLWWAAAFAWCLRMGRSPWLAFALGPLVFHQFWGLGFHPFDLGMALMLLAAAFADRLLASWDLRAALALTLTALATFLAHALPFAMLGLVVGLLSLVWRPGWRRLLALGGCLLPGLALWRWQAGLSDVGLAKLARVLGGGPNLDPERWRLRLTLLPTHLGETLSGDLDLARVVLIALAILALSLIALGGRAAPSIRSSSLLRWRALLISSVFFALFFVLPAHFRAPVYLWEAAGRFALPAVFFLFLGFPPPELAWRSSLPYAALVLMALLWPLHLAGQYRAFDSAQAPLLRATAQLEPGERVLTLSREPRTHPGFEPPVYTQLASRVQLLYGGFNPSFWRRPIPFPFRVKERLPAPHWRRHERVSADILDVYDVVLTHQGGPLGSGWDEVWREGEWALHRPH